MDASLTPWLWIAAIGLIGVGLVGTVLPLLPGVPFVFLGLWLAAWIDGYTEVSGWTVAVLGVLCVIAMVLDFIAASMGAKKAGASKQAVTGALLGSIIGTLTLGLPGLIAGPFVGALAGELLAQRTLQQATRVGIASWLGLLVGTIAKLGLTIMMVSLFIFAYFI